MTTPWEALAKALTRQSERIDALPSVREATVTDLTPIMVQFDTDTTETAVHGSLVNSDSLPVGSRVLTLKLRHYVWILGLRNGVPVPTVLASVPEPIRKRFGSVSTITATSWALATDYPVITLDLPYACWVDIRLHGWLVAAATGEVRVAVDIRGATTIPPATDSEWGLVLYRNFANGASTEQQGMSTTYFLNEGAHTIAVYAYQSGGGTKQFNYGVIEAVPLRPAI